MRFLKIIFFCFSFFIVKNNIAQQITGYWQGRVGNGINSKKLELKLVAKGDSIVGTSYYFNSKSNYRRYSIKGYFNTQTNAVVWWDDVLIESKQPKLKVFSPGEIPFIAEADFNCPGGGVMMLDGKAKPNDGKENNETKIHLDKQDKTSFDDEWNFIVDNWMDGGNNINLIDSVQNIAFQKPEYEKATPIDENNSIAKIENKPKVDPEVILELPVKKEKPISINEKPNESVTTNTNKPIEFLDIKKPEKKIIQNQDKPAEQLELDTIWKGNPNNISKNTISKPEEIKQNSLDKPMDVTKTEKPTKETVIAPEKIIETKFVERKKVVLTEIPIEADSIEMHFYDNAEVDGDSISLFLNNKLLLEHIRLTDKPYVVKLNKEQLSTAIELTMVAENLGSIPPNTSYMIAFVNGKQYTATLSSTEQTSAVIRFKKNE